VAVGVQPFQARLLRGDLGVAARAAHDANGDEAFLAGLERELDGGLVGTDGDDGLDQTLAVARDAAVEGEADGIDHRRLPRTRRADEGEHVGVSEVDLGLVPEGAEATHAQPQRSHQAAPDATS
jgi:hypothetical protein